MRTQQTKHIIINHKAESASSYRFSDADFSLTPDSYKTNKH